MTGTILITSRSFGSGSLDAVARLRAEGFELVTSDPVHDLAALRSVLPRVDGWIAGTGQVGEDHFALAPRLRIVARYGVGIDAVDIRAASRRGITVTNTPGANTESVADLALALILNGLRAIAAGDRAVRVGDWSALRGKEISSVSVGVAGFGRIGREVARRVCALGARAVVVDPYLPAEEELPERVSRAESVADLATCDVVSLHAPGGRRIIDATWLDRAGGVLLVNTARADLVDESAVAAAVRDGRLSGYAADMLDGEYHDAAGSPLLSPDLAHRVTITPHLGAQTVQAIDRMTSISMDEVLAVLGGAAPRHAVSAPDQ